MAQPRNAPPNYYLVHSLDAPPAAPPDLRGAEAAALLEKLRTFIDITGKEELEQTVNNYTQQMLFSAVRVSERQCPELQKTLASAQAKILAVFGTRAERGFGRRAPLVGLGHNSRRMHSLKGIVPEVAAHVSVLLCAASGGGGVAQPYEPTAASTCDGFGRRTPLGFISP